jgi:trans-aconitate methyltransferase
LQRREPVSETMSEPSRRGQEDWNANLYDAKHSFVWKFGADLLPLLDPKSGERILDIGCGTGHLTAQIAECGAQVVGIDRSPEMAAAARTGYPNLQFEVADARNVPYRSEFDAVFSNATLHWIPESELVVQNVWTALRPGGRFVAEFGGKGNIAKMVSAFDQALAELHSEPQSGINPWYYPGVSEYSTLLENNGFEVRFMTLFDRPTPLADGDAGMRNWITMFASDYYAKLGPESREAFLRRVEDLLRPELFRDGQWWADYRRIRFAAWK